MTKSRAAPQNRFDSTSRCLPSSLPPQPSSGLPPKNRTTLSGVFAASLAAVAMGLASDPLHAQTSDITIGAMFDLSGATAAVGKDVMEGTLFAVDRLNKTGGVIGHNIAIKYLDTATNPQRAVDQGTILARGGVKFLMAPQSSASAIAASRSVSERYKIPMCVNVSNADELTIKNYQPYVFSMSVNTYMEEKALVDWVSQRPFKRYAVLGADFVGARSGAARFKEFMKEKKPEVEIVSEEYPRFGATDYTSSINKIEAAKPDFVLCLLFASDLITFSKQAEELGFFNSINGNFLALYDSETLRALGRAAPVGTSGFQRAPFNQLIKNAPVGRDYVSAYKAANGNYPSDWATEGYECVMAWAQAVTQANSFDADPVMLAIGSTAFSLPRGNLVIGKSDHQLEVPTYIGSVAESTEFDQPIVDITTVVPGADVRPGPDELRRMRGN